MKKIFITEEQLKYIINEGSSQEIIAYHGSNSEIKNFLTEFVGGQEANDQEGPGIYFTTSKDDAMQYGNILYTVKLKPRLLLTDDKPRKGINKANLIKLVKMKDDWEMNAQDWDENAEIGLKKSLDSVFEYNDTNKDIITQIYLDYYRYDPVEYVNNATNLGYDGILVHKEWGAEHIIVYNPNIIQIINVEHLKQE